MSQNKMKQAVAEAALEFVPQDSIVGVGTGSTVNYFIEALAGIKNKIDGAVASSKASAELLKQNGIHVFDLNAVDEIPVYIDGADEINCYFQMIKGGGGALTSEKIIAAVSQKFICIADETKKVELLGSFPVAIEVIPMARSFVARELVKLGGNPVFRNGFITDHGNLILDVYNLQILEPAKLEEQINNITGVVTNGIFAKRSADILLLGLKDGSISQTSHQDINI